MAVYLDYNSSTPVAPQVVSCVAESLQRDWANPSSDSLRGRSAREVLDTARERVARLVHADCAQDIIFTSGGTESNNMAILSGVEWGRQHTTRPHVILSNVEHVATIKPVEHLAAQGIIDYTEVAVNQDGCLEVSDVMAHVRPETVLVTLMLANNETGVIFPIQRIGKELKAVNQKRKHRVWFHVDAAQAIGKMEVNVQELGVDYLSIVGHKFYGPRIGALYVRRVLSERIVSPVARGGGQEGGLRPGTENTPMIAGLGVAALLVSENLDTYTSHMREVRDYLLEQLLKNTKCVVNCDQSARLANTLSVGWSDCPLTGHQLLAKCPRVVASTTAACHSQAELSGVLLLSGVPKDVARTTVRLSVGRETSRNDIDTVVSDLVHALQSASITPCLGS
uniref:Selenocysteine lyase n=1 Tax=Graphocephala atropunctata TaxID=36148 RepID=A0A1B6KCN2_9HEMI